MIMKMLFLTGSSRSVVGEQGADLSVVGWSPSRGRAKKPSRISELSLDWLPGWQPKKQEVENSNNTYTKRGKYGNFPEESVS